MTSKHYPLSHRLKLFAAVVQPTFLYGCPSWTLTRKRESVIRSLQRKMLRSIVGSRRKTTNLEGETVLEEWLPWFRRATKEAEKARRDHHIADWVDEVARRKFQWAGHVARRTDGRWSQFLLQWAVFGSRQQGRPRTRWTDSLVLWFRFMDAYCARP